MAFRQEEFLDKTPEAWSIRKNPDKLDFKIKKTSIPQETWLGDEWKDKAEIRGDYLQKNVSDKVFAFGIHKVYSKFITRTQITHFFKWEKYLN